MPKLNITKDALDFWEKLDAKQYKQIGRRVLSLLSDPLPHDSTQLKGYAFRRVDIGEYRIIYRFDVLEEIVAIECIGLRNDDDVYKQLRRKA